MSYSDINRQDVLFHLREMFQANEDDLASHPHFNFDYKIGRSSAIAEAIQMVIGL